jgi:hypothetical protein
MATTQKDLRSDQLEDDDSSGPLTVKSFPICSDQSSIENPHCLTFYDYNVETLDKGTKELVEGRKIAAIYKNAISSDLRNAAIKNLEHHHAKQLYEGADGIGRIGSSLYENQFGPDRKAKYFEDAAASREMSRNVFGQYGSPVDTLRALCDELPSFNGAGILRLKRGTAFAGLIRYLDSGASILPHTDNVSWDMPDSIICNQIECQIAFNAHLQSASEGGEITIYSRRPTKIEYDAYRMPAPNVYAISEAFLPAPSVTVRAEAGDIVLFNASLPHSVAETKGSTRYTVSCFLGVDRKRFIHLFS